MKCLPIPPHGLLLSAVSCLLLASNAHANEPPVRANEPNITCASQGGWKDGECGWIAGCLISGAIGGFDCFQELGGGTHGYWPDPMPQPNELFPPAHPLSGGGNNCLLMNQCVIEPRMFPDLNIDQLH